MIDDTVSKIEERIANMKSVDEARKQELLGLIATLRTEVLSLAETRADDAETIARYAELSAHEVTRAGSNPKLQRITLEGLETSVEGFEAEHPQLASIVGRICKSLSDIGI